MSMASAWRPKIVRPAAGSPTCILASIPLGRRDQRSALEYFLSSRVDEKESALSAPSRPFRRALNGPTHLPGKKVLYGDPSNGIAKKKTGYLGKPLRDTQADLGRSGERIALNVVDIERPSLEFVASSNVLICLVASAVDPFEDVAEVIRSAHGSTYPAKSPRLPERRYAAPLQRRLGSEGTSHQQRRQ